MLALAALLAALPRTALGAIETETVATGLTFPTNIALTPDGRIFFAERDTGQVRIIEDGRLLPQPFAGVGATGPGSELKETGLLGIALDPNFASDPWVYVYYSSPADGNNHLSRIRAEGNVAGPRENLLTLLPTANAYHNGGDLAFGPDGKLYVTVGEGHEAGRAQDPNDLGGKILRLNPDGTIPEDNPFGADNPAYSMGHRNSFGICFDPTTGQLWETENGPSSDDEVNLIEAGENYGWPVLMGPGGGARYRDPVLDFPEIIVPTGCAVWGGDLYFGDFGGRLHRLDLPAAAPAADELVARFPAGITDLQVAPDGSLYVATADSILSAAVPPSPSASRTASPLPTPSPVASTASPSPVAASSGRAGPIAAAIILAVVIAGGLAFRAWGKRSSS